MQSLGKMLYCSESAKYSQIWFLFFVSEFVEIFRLGVNFTEIVVMPEKQTREAACERSSYKVHLAFFL
jgi:hypothetical protein